MQENTRVGRVRVSSAHLWRFGVFFLAPALTFLAIAEEVAEREPLHFDRLLVPGIGPLHFEPLAFFLGVVTVLGGGIGLVVVASIPVGRLLSRGRYPAASFIPLSLGGAWVINRILKSVFDRQRPAYATSPLPANWKWILAGMIVAALVVAWPTRWRRVSLLALVALGVMGAIDLIITEAIPLTHGFDSFPSGHAVGSMSFAAAMVALTWHTRSRWLVLAGGGMFVVLVGVSRIYFGLHYASDIFGGWLLAVAWIALLHRTMRTRLRREVPTQV
jgi:undecaprenyl-diphosphatase